MSRRAEDWLLGVWSRRGLASTLLLPPAWLYGNLAARRMRAQARRAWRAPVPVLVVGNILVGGTGKTPLTAAICKALQASGWQPGIVSRGYGVRVGPSPRLSDTCAAAGYLGDEPAVLHAATGAPVSVHPQRVRAAQQLLAAHPETDLLIADDGLQHRALARDMEIIVQDARGSGNGRLLPAGPLREPARRIGQADWLITQLAAGEAPPRRNGLLPADRQVTMRLLPAACRRVGENTALPWAKWCEQYRATPCSAAAGIGRPERFFAMLRAAGVNLVQTRRLPDHGALTRALLATLPAGPILTTAKDAVKCADVEDPRLWVVEANPQFDDSRWLEALDGQLRARARERRR